MRWLVPVAIALMVALLLFLGSGALPAQAHEWFDRWCCQGTDCGPAPLGSVKWTPSGWRVATPAINVTVPFDDQRIRYVPPEQPQQFYICEWPKRHLRCLYTPEPGG